MIHIFYYNFTNRLIDVCVNSHPLFGTKNKAEVTDNQSAE